MKKPVTKRLDQTTRDKMNRLSKLTRFRDETHVIEMAVHELYEKHSNELTEA